MPHIVRGYAELMLIEAANPYFSLSRNILSGEKEAASLFRETDDTRAYVVMPSFETFEQYARRVEAEMPANEGRADKSPPR